MNHRHILVKAKGLSNAPRDPASVVRWLVRLADAVHMNIMMGPFAQRCDKVGNAGVTGAVVIETSHASIHCWDEGTPFLQMDLYSCAPFCTRKVLELVREFGPSEIEWMLVDRNGAPELLEQGTYTL